MLIPSRAADGALAIDIHRLGVMMGQAREIEIALGLSPQPEPEADRATLYDDLVAAVRGYNDLTAAACTAKLLPGDLCAGPYRPTWLAAEPSGFDEARMRSATDAAANRLIPFWQAICDKAPKPAGDEPVCPME